MNVECRRAFDLLVLNVYSTWMCVRGSLPNQKTMCKSESYKAVKTTSEAIVWGAPQPPLCTVCLRVLSALPIP